MGLSRTRPDKIVLIIQVRSIMHSLQAGAKSASCSQLVLEHPPCEQDQFMFKADQPPCNFCTLWLRIMTQVEEPHSLQGSEKFEAYPIHLSQQSLVDGHGTPSIKLQDISSTPHKTHGIVTMEAYAVPCTVSL